MSFKVYWTGPDGEPCALEFADMSVALKHSQDLRNIHKRRFVTMVSENPDLVGPQGVDAVEDGLLPDGTAYTWKKRRK